jgi:hypothetical protein
LFYYDGESTSLLPRAFIVHEIFSSISWLGIFFPFVDGEFSGFNVNLHNQLLVIYSAFGILGIVYYYFIFFDKVNSLLFRYRGIKLSLILVTVIGGFTVLPSLHLYTSIFMAYILSFYNEFGKFITLQQKKLG